MRRSRALLVCVGVLAIAAGAFAPAAVARDRDAATSAPPERVGIEVLASIRLDQDVYTVAEPGKVRITVSGVAGHAITLTERPQVQLVTPGPSSAVVKLRRGTYHVTSVIPGHTKAGIRALLVVG